MVDGTMQYSMTSFQSRCSGVPLALITRFVYIGNLEGGTGACW